MAPISASVNGGASAKAGEIQYLTNVETALLQEIQVLQQTLEQSRHHSGRGGGRRPANKSRRPRNTPSSLSLAPKRPRSRVISVSLRLPSKEDRATVRQELFDFALPPKAVLSLDKQRDLKFVWVGLGNPTNAPRTDSSTVLYDVWGRAPNPQRNESEIQVKIDDGMIDSFLMFSENILYRILHYDYGSVAEDSDSLDQNYEIYKEVTRRFAQTVCEIYEEGDLIWVHNHHLMMLPGMIRGLLWYAKIGYFLYSSFPSAELFRILPMRADILNGVLGADLVGFYSYDYAKQFVSACSHLLGLESTPSAIEADPRAGRKCEIGIYPAGIDVKTLKAHVSLKTLKARVVELREQFSGRLIVVGVERLDDCFAGIPLTLLAFQKLLQDNPGLVGKVVLVQVAMLPHESRADNVHRTLMTQINELVGTINATFGSFTTSPVHYITKALEPSELHALMCAGHVCIVSRLRDGMGLIPHEWTVCQHGGYKGPIILSEFSGSARSFSTALHVNPWDVEDVALKIREALEMDADVRAVQNDAAYRFVREHTAEIWGFNFLDDLEQVEGAQHGTGNLVTPLLDTNAVIKAYRASSAISAMSSPISSSLGLSSMGAGDSIRLSTVLSPGSVSGERSSELEIPIPNMGSKRSSMGSLAGSVGASQGTDTTSNPRRVSTKKKLFILDYEGTLTQFQPLAEISYPSERIRTVISNILLASVDNVVLILSGHGKRNLEKWFGDLDVFLAAEDGCFLRGPGEEYWIPLYAQPSGRKPNIATTDSFNDMTPFQNPFIENKVTSAGNGGGAIKKEGSGEKLNGNKEVSFALAAGLYKGSVSSMGSYEGGSSDSDEMVSKWKVSVRQVMEHFAERTPGVLVEEGDAMLTWHFVDADRSFGRSQARALQKHLELFLIQNLNMNIVSEEGRNRWLKVRPVRIDKADAVYSTLEMIRENGGRSTNIDELEAGEARIDFIFCIGDDRADEGMFELLRDEKQRVELGISGISSRIFTCRVGSNATAAAAAIESTHQVLDFLQELVHKTHGPVHEYNEVTERSGREQQFAKSAPS